jgi:hypothetical protein
MKQIRNPQDSAPRERATKIRLLEKQVKLFDRSFETIRDFSEPEHHMLPNGELNAMYSSAFLFPFFQIAENLRKLRGNAQDYYRAGTLQRTLGELATNPDAKSAHFNEAISKLEISLEMNKTNRTRLELGFAYISRSEENGENEIELTQSLLKAVKILFLQEQKAAEKDTKEQQLLLTAYINWPIKQIAPKIKKII